MEDLPGRACSHVAEAAAAAAAQERTRLVAVERAELAEAASCVAADADLAGKSLAADAEGTAFSAAGRYSGPPPPAHTAPTWQQTSRTQPLLALAAKVSHVGHVATPARQVTEAPLTAASTGDAQPAVVTIAFAVPRAVGGQAEESRAETVTGVDAPDSKDDQATDDGVDDEEWLEDP